MRNPLKSAFVVRHYRTIISSLVLLNTALIFFLIVFVWSYGPSRDTRNLLPGASNIGTVQRAVVVEDNVIAWSRPGGVDSGGASRGVLERGHGVNILGSEQNGGELWLRVNWDSREGWVRAGQLRYIRALE